MNTNVLISCFFSIFLALSFIGCGHFVIRRICNLILPSLSVEIPLAFSIGFGVYALIYFGFYCVSNNPTLPVILLLHIPGFIAALSMTKRLSLEIAEVKNVIFMQSAKNKIMVGLVLLAFFALMFCLLMNTIAPVKLGDAVSGYIETSRWLYHNGFKSFDPYNSKYSTMPVFTEIIYSISFVTGTEITAKCIDAITGILFLTLVYGFSRLYLNRILSLYSVLSLLMLVSFLWIFGGGKIDIPSQFIYFAALCCLLLNLIQYKKNIVYLSAFLIGISLEQKYTVFILLPFYILCLLYILKVQKFTFLYLVGTTLFCGFIVFAVFVPHLIKDYIWTGNPFAPFQNSFFKSRYVFDEHHHGDLTFMSWKDTLLFPYYIFVKNKLPFITLIGLIAFVATWKKEIRIGYVFWFLLFQLIIWIVVLKEYWYNERFIFSMLIFFILFGFIGLKEFYKKYNWVQIGLFLFVFGNLLYHVNENRRFLKYIKYAIGKQSEASWQDEYNLRGSNILKKTAPYLSTNEKLFILRGGVSYYVPYDQEKFVSTESEILEGKRSADILAYLKQKGFKYIFFGLKDDLEAKNLPIWIDKKNLFLKSNDGLVFKI